MYNTLSITKIFGFESAHALYNYPGACQYIHGHSYELHVSIGKLMNSEEPLGGIGILYDFKDLKKIIVPLIDEYFDHKLILSDAYLEAHPEMKLQQNLVILPYEPSAENLLLFFAKHITGLLPSSMQLQMLRLYETKSSYAEWSIANH